MATCEMTRTKFRSSMTQRSSLMSHDETDDSYSEVGRERLFHQQVSPLLVHFLFLHAGVHLAALLAESKHTSQDLFPLLSLPHLIFTLYTYNTHLPIF